MAKVPNKNGRDQAAEYDEWVANPPSVNDAPKATYASGNPMVAACGHEDPLGHLTGTVCGKCARKNHKKAMGK
jgi:hypothetical protein